jgi:hypothetical protein
MRRWNFQPIRQELEKRLPAGPSTPSIHSFMKKIVEMILFQRKAKMLNQGLKVGFNLGVAINLEEYS